MRKSNSFFCEAKSFFTGCDNGKLYPGEIGLPAPDATANPGISRISQFLVVLITLFLQINFVYANNESETVTVPWDSVLAEMQVISSLSEADSVREQLYTNLFERYQISIDDYRKFHRDFMQKDREGQRQFLENIQKIIQHRQEKPVSDPDKIDSQRQSFNTHSGLFSDYALIFATSKDYSLVLRYL